MYNQIRSEKRNVSSAKMECEEKIVTMYCNRFDFNRFDFYFGSYLAGLWEGDGHVSLKDKRVVHPKPTFHITFHKKDLPLAKKLLAWIAVRVASANVGSVYEHKYNNSCVLNIYSVSGLIVVVCLIQRHLRTPKGQKINTIVEWLNAKHNAQIIKKDVTLQPVAQSAWFAGFVDADGCFSIDLRRTPRFKLSCNMQLNQRQICPVSGQSYRPCLDKLVYFLCARKLYLIKPNKGKSYFAIKASSAKSKNILRYYFTRWPLLSSKHHDYHVWCSVDNVIRNGHASTKVNIIENLKQAMNNKRLSFDWSHLEEYERRFVFTRS